MQIEFIRPINRATDRMRQILFKPFDITKWFVLGFTAFLAHLLDGGGNGGSSNISDDDAGEFFEAPGYAWRWIQDNPDWFALIIAGVVLLIALLVLATWLSSRGKFMFLDNVVNNRALVRQPWGEFRTFGNSLFFWRLAYGFIALVVFLSFFGYCYDTLYEMYYMDDWRIPAIAGMITAGLILFIIFGYITLFLSDFVVPLMYKNEINAMPAWGKFVELFKTHTGWFLLYGVVVFVLYLLVFMLIVLVGIFTCCIGFLFLVIPYISSVVLLPISVTFRSFSVEFLQQFGPEFRIFPGTDEKQTGATGANK